MMPPSPPTLSQVLHYWLSHTPNYDEVTRWYLGWKGCFPSQVSAETGRGRVKAWRGSLCVIVRTRGVPLVRTMPCHLQPYP